MDQYFASGDTGALTSGGEHPTDEAPTDAAPKRKRTNTPPNEHDRAKRAKAQ